MNTTPSFQINTVAEQRFVHITLGGLFGLDDVVAFATAQREAYKSLPTPVTDHVTLCDVSQCRIQLHPVVEAFRALLNQRALMGARIGFVVGQSSARMQLRRLISRDNAKVFDDVAEAKAWLFAERRDVRPEAVRRFG